MVETKSPAALSISEFGISDSPRDEIWRAAHETLSEVLYNEKLADVLTSRWQTVDRITKVIVALTASGSAVAGWTLWQQSGWRSIWAVIAGVTAVLSLTHGVLGVPGILTSLSDLRAILTNLRADLDTFIYQMRINPQFPLDEFIKEFLEFQKRRKDTIQGIKHDMLQTKRLENEIRRTVQAMFASTSEQG